MPTYRIADLTVGLQANGHILARRSQPYFFETTRPVDFTIFLSPDFLQHKQQENPHLSMDECEYIWTGADFYRRLLNFDGLMLHASALAYEGRSYLFSASCGTGKSTHARLWRQHFGRNQVSIINDDKPALRYMDNSFYVYGTPWSGKSEQNLNVKVPLQAVCFLEQSRHNWIERLEAQAALKLILNQTLRPREIQGMESLLTILDKLIRQIPFYQMGCTIDVEAVDMAYQAMSSI